MTRAEFRRQRKAQENKRLYSDKEIQDIYNKAYTDAANDALVLALAIPLTAYYNHSSDLVKLSVDGKSREVRFTEYILNTYSEFENGEHTLEDFKQFLWEQCGIRFEKS